MKYAKEIGEQQRVARDLAGERQTLLQQIPFGAELELTRFDMERVAVPIVAVAGAYSAGKSALINAALRTPLLPVGVTPTTLVPVIVRGGTSDALSVGTSKGLETRPVSDAEMRHLVTDKDSSARYVIRESPKASRLPWQWLDTPGANAELHKPMELRVAPREVADICVLATSALQPLSLSDLTQLMQLGNVFQGDTLCIALTRTDQLQAGELPSVKRYVQEALADALPERSLKVFPVSNKDASSVTALNEHLAAVVYQHQRAQLGAALTAWKEMLSHLEELLAMRQLAEVKLATIQRIRTRLDAHIVDSGALLMEDLPHFMDETCRELGATLPAPRRQLLENFQSRFGRRFGERLQEIGDRLNSDLTAELQQDLTNKASVTLANRFLSLLEPSNPFFDWVSAAAVGGTVGAGAAVSAAFLAATLPPVGLVMAGAAVIGGLLGGFMGSASTIDSTEELKEKIARPVTQQYQSHLRTAIAHYRDDLAHLCRLMEKVSVVFSSPSASNYNVPAMQKLIKFADDRRQKILVPRFERIEFDRQAAESAERLRQLQATTATASSPTRLVPTKTPAASKPRKKD